MFKSVLKGLCILVLGAGLAGANSGASSGANSSANSSEPAPRRVLLYGDSLAAGYGLVRAHALAGQLESRLVTGGLAVEVVNGGVSGDTTAAGLARLDWSLPEKVDLVIVVLGGNDALRGLVPARSHENLDTLIAALKTRGLMVLLTGMRAPPNLGLDYAAAFEPMYASLAKKHQVAFYPFLLEGVAGDPGLNQADGIHPNKQGVALIVDGLEPLVRAALVASQP